MADFERITFNPEVMGGRPCIRGMRVTVGDVTAALRYAAWRAQEREIVLPGS
jgi:uncharacterized protein (DUF433 family)